MTSSKINKFYTDNFTSMKKQGAYPTDSDSGVIYRNPKGEVISKEKWLEEADKQFKK